jgi:hypothetical protein
MLAFCRSIAFVFSPQVASAVSATATSIFWRRTKPRKGLRVSMGLLVNSNGIAAVRWAVKSSIGASDDYALSASVTSSAVCPLQSPIGRDTL